MNNDTIKVTLFDMDYIPSYRLAEAERQANEQERIAYMNEFKEKVDSGEYDPKDGITPTIGENGNWFLEDVDTGKPSRGEQGEQGIQGERGADGLAGANATINGLEAINILAGENITLDQEDDNLTINADVKAYTGDKEQLNTEDKTDFVNAINEVVEKLGSGAISSITSTEENPIYLYDLEDGIYLLKGYFRFHLSSDKYINLEDYYFFKVDTNERSFYFRFNASYSGLDCSSTTYGKKDWVKGSDYHGTLSSGAIKPLTVINDLNTENHSSLKVLSAYQGYVLRKRIGDLSILSTTDKTSIVNAINEIANTFKNFESIPTISYTDIKTINEEGIFNVTNVPFNNANTGYNALGIAKLSNSNYIGVTLLGCYGYEFFVLIGNRLINSTTEIKFKDMSRQPLITDETAPIDNPEKIVSGKLLAKFISSKNDYSSFKNTIKTNAKNLLDAINELYDLISTGGTGSGGNVKEVVLCENVIDSLTATLTASISDFDSLIVTVKNESGAIRRNIECINPSVDNLAQEFNIDDIQLGSMTYTKYMINYNSATELELEKGAGLRITESGNSIISATDSETLYIEKVVGRKIV